MNITGIFLLLLTFTNLSPNPRLNPYRVEFSTYQDCLTAGEALATWLHNPRGSSYTISCASKETAVVHAIWSGGPLP